MKFLLIVILAIIAMVLAKIKKEYRMHITAGFIVCVIILNVAYNVYAMNSVMPLFRPINQLTYQLRNLDAGEYPDALLPLIVKGKKIHVIDDPDKETDHWWPYNRYHYRNAVNYIRFWDGEVISDLPKDTVISDDVMSEFTDVGYANDMFRNTFFWADRGNLLYSYQEINYFGFYWWYNSQIPAIHIYMIPEGLAEADEVVWIWQDIEGEPAENTYVMSKDYYEKNIR